MATWRSVIETEKYQNLPPTQKMLRKRNFYNTIISRSDKFRSLDKEERNQIKDGFFLSRPEEGFRKKSLEEVMEMFAEKPVANISLLKAWEGVKLVDIPVEHLAKFIEPDPGTAEPGIKGVAKFFPRQMTAELLRAYKPSTLLPFLAIAGAAKPLLRPAGRFIASKTPQALKDVLLKQLTIGKGQPLGYQQLVKKAQLAKLKGAREAEKAGMILSTAREKIVTTPLKGKPIITKPGQPLSLEHQKYLGRIFRKEVIESPTIKAHPKYQQLKAISNEGRNIMDKWSKELIKSGLTKETATKTIEENIGKYMARMYTTKLKPQTISGVFKNLRLRLNGLKRRKDLSVEVRNLLGEIKEPALPTAIRVKEISSSVANNKLFSQVAKNPEWTSAKQLKGLVKMPDTPAVGALKGKWVIPQIAEDVNAISVAGQQAEGIYLKALQAWKFGKVVLNPAAQVRNVISNTILLDLSGTNHIRQAQLYPKAFKAYLSKNQIYTNALDDGAIGGEFVGGEIKKMQDFYIATQGGNLQKWANVAKYPFKKAANMYQGSEQISKLVKYMDVLEKGGTRQVAAEAAQKTLFNYNEIPKFIELVKKSPFGAPFITFTYKALPRIGEALVDRPLSVYKYKALFNSWNETSRKYQGKTPDEFAREKKLLPPWLLRDVGGVPMNLLLPWKDKHNRTQWLNLEYIMPIGQAPEIMERGVMRGGISNPLFNIIADLSRNKDFRGQDIVLPESNKAEAMKAATSYIYRQLVPNLAPAIPTFSKGGYSFEKIIDAIYKRPDYADRTRDLTPALMDTLLGIKINALDVDEAEMFKYSNKQKRINEMRKQLLKLNHPRISERERAIKTEIIFKKIQRILEE